MKKILKSQFGIAPLALLALILLPILAAIEFGQYEVPVGVNEIRKVQKHTGYTAISWNQIKREAYAKRNQMTPQEVEDSIAFDRWLTPLVESLKMKAEIVEFHRKQRDLLAWQAVATDIRKIIENEGRKF